ncbi:MAG TPA: hypothetical protein VF574_12200 [Allosphingosinicella sp.]|jgi:hypothetical protein
MDTNFIAAVQGLAVRERPALETALAELLATYSKSGRPLPLREARDKFTSVNKAAREGHAQLLRGEPGGETVLVSVRDLATMLQAAASTLTLADALTVSGFCPAGGRLVLDEALETEDLLELAEPKRTEPA